MQISDLTSNPALTVERIRSEGLDALRAGQQLPARVIAPTAQGQARIELGGHSIPVRTELPLKGHEQLLVEVVRARAPLELRVVPQPPAAQQSSATDPRLDTLRNMLPRQLPVTQLIERLLTLPPPLPKPLPSPATGTVPPAAPSGQPATPASPSPVPPMPTLAERIAQLLVSGAAGAVRTVPTGGSAPVTPGATANMNPATHPVTTDARVTLPVTRHRDALASALQGVLNQQLSLREPLTTERLKRAFEQSGLFLEARLAGGSVPQTDLKASLVKLLFQLRLPTATLPSAEGQARPATPNPAALPQAGLLGELAQLAEGGLARVVVNQLASLPGQESNSQMWHFGLPLRDGEETTQFRLKFRQDGGSGDGEEMRWSVTLDFALEPLGPVSVFLILQGEQISSHFVAERADSAQRLGAAMPQLGSAFERAGLTLGRITATQGNPAPSDDQPPPSASTPSLLDERA